MWIDGHRHRHVHDEGFGRVTDRQTVEMDEDKRYGIDGDVNQKKPGGTCAAACSHARNISHACLTSSHVAWRDAEKNRWRKFSVKLRDLHISDNTGSFFCFFETSAARIHTIQESVCTVEDDKEEVSLLASFNTLNIVDGYLVSFFASILHHPPELSSSSNSWMSMALSGGHNSQSPHATAHS